MYLNFWYQSVNLQIHDYAVRYFCILYFSTGFLMHFSMQIAFLLTLRKNTVLNFGKITPVWM